MPSPASLFASILFGAIGLGAMMYGKRMREWRPIAIGAALSGYTFFVDQTWALYAIGAGLCLALYVLRD